MTVEAEEVDDGAHGATHPHLRRQSALPGRGGLARIAAAVSNSIRGLREGLLTEAAVKQELALAAVLLPALLLRCLERLDMARPGRKRTLRADRRIPEYRGRTPLQPRYARSAMRRSGSPRISPRPLSSSRFASPASSGWSPSSNASA